MNCPGDVEFGLILRVELCAGEFPVPAIEENKDKINSFSISDGMSKLRISMLQVCIDI